MYVTVAPLATSMVLAAPSVTPRFVASVNDPEAESVPPFRFSCVATTEPGAVPRLVSVLIENVPAETVVVPLYEFEELLRVKVPAACFVSEPVPETVPERVWLDEDAIVRVELDPIETLPA